MERRQVEIEVASLDISEAKATYIATKGVSIADVTEVFENRPRFFSETTAPGNVRYSFLGPNLSDRFLLVAIAPVDLK
jgi:hypothetical protein